MGGGATSATLFQHPWNFYLRFPTGEDLAFPPPSACCHLAAVLLPRVLQGRSQVGQRGLAKACPASGGAEASQLVSQCRWVPAQQQPFAVQHPQGSSVESLKSDLPSLSSLPS